MSDPYSTLRAHALRGLAAACVTAALSVLTTAAAGGQDPAAWLDPYREPAARLIAAAEADDAAWRRLAELTDTFGHRLSGSPALEAAIAWSLDTMKRDGLENVRGEPVMVPRWVRGRESVDLLEPFPRPLVMLGLGGSVGTPPGGVTADALVVSSFADLETRAKDVPGRIVVFDVPYTSYGQTVQYRSAGASRAARLGAVAVLVRSVGPVGLRTPHTGSLRYDEAQPKIPAAAISAEDASALRRLQDRGVRLRLRLAMEAHTLPDVESANVIGEIAGRERPDEIVVVACHLDSWDAGTGASDDAAGCIATWEAVRLMKQAGLRPRRTVRVVLFTNEENGLRGGLAYRDRHRDVLASHVMMLEADLGVFPPLAFGYTGSDKGREVVTQIATLLDRVGATRVAAQGGGADIGPSVQAAGIPAMSLSGDPGTYFVIHHTPADTVDRIEPDDLARAVAAIAVMTYIVADLPERLGGVPEPSTR
jgi:carboxypeptidase Q